MIRVVLRLALAGFALSSNTCQEPHCDASPDYIGLLQKRGDRWAGDRALAASSVQTERRQAAARANAWTVVDTTSDVARQGIVRDSVVAGVAGIDQATCVEKMGKMSTSAFGFYRGTAGLYYEDMDSASIISGATFYNYDAATWIQGDYHGQNMGAFDDKNEAVVYDVNDFDEAFVTSYLYDVYRMAASVALVADENGFSASDAKEAMEKFTEKYLDQLEDFRGGVDEDNFQWKEAQAYGRLDNFLDDAEQDNSRRKMLDKYSEKVSGVRYFKTKEWCASNACDGGYNEDVETIPVSLKAAVVAAIKVYYASHLTDPDEWNGVDKDAWFAVSDVAKRVHAGTGSLGRPRFYALVEGKTTDADDDRILDIKIQTKPSVYPYLAASVQANVDGNVANDADRVATAQHTMIDKPDRHLGWLELRAADVPSSDLAGFYSVRERSPYKESFDDSELSTQEYLNEQAEQYGIVMAGAHARADKAPFVQGDFKEIMHRLTDHHHAQFNSEASGFGAAYSTQVKNDFAYFVTLSDGGAWTTICGQVKSLNDACTRKSRACTRSCVRARGPNFKFQCWQRCSRKC